MPFKKTLSFLIKIVIVFLSLFFIYHELIDQRNSNSLDFSSIFLNIKSKYLIILSVFCMMFLNWFIESYKWRFMIGKLEQISLTTSLRAIFSGITVSSFTPNRIGEYGGRVFCLESCNRIQAVVITVLGSMAQLLTTLMFGSLAFCLLHDSINTKLFFSLEFEISTNILLLIFLINFLLLFLFFKVSIFVDYFDRFKYFSFLKKYTSVLSKFSSKELAFVFFLSIIRYFVFSLQFLILLNVFDVNISFYTSMLSIMLIFLFMTLTPTVAITEIGVRGSVALLVLGIFSNNIVGILSSTVVLWIINLIIPAIIGSLFIFNLKFFRK